MTAGAVQLEPAHVAAMCAHASRDYPNECCGLLFGPAGQTGMVSEVVAIPNIQDRLHAEDPDQYPRAASIAYFMDPDAQLAATRSAAARGLELRGFYHSHPDHDAYFSAEDRHLAAPWDEPLFPGTAYVVMAVTRTGVRAASQFVWDGERGDYVEHALRLAEPADERWPSERMETRNTIVQCIDVGGRSPAEALIAARDALRLLPRDALLEIASDDRQTAETTLGAYFEKRRLEYELERLAEGRYRIRVRNGA